MNMTRQKLTNIARVLKPAALEAEQLWLNIDNKQETVRLSADYADGSSESIQIPLSFIPEGEE